MTAMDDRDDDKSEGFKSTIGSSEIGTIVGVNPYESPFDLWAQKKGKIPPKVQTLDMLIGIKAQPMIIDLYERETKRTVVKMFDEPHYHPTLTWARASLDAFDAAEKMLVEAKSVGLRGSHRWGEPGTDSMPQEYLAQVAWQMFVEDVDKADVAVLIGHDFRIYHVERDTELEDSLIIAATEFYERFMVGNEVPDVQGERVGEYLRVKFPRNFQPLRRATLEEALAVSLFVKAKEKLKIAENEKEWAGNMIRGFIGEADGIEGDTFKATWKATKEVHKTDWKALAEALRTKYDVPADSYNLIREMFSEINPGARRLLVRAEGEDE